MGILAFTRSNGAKHVIMQCFNEFPPSLNRVNISSTVPFCDWFFVSYKDISLKLNWLVESIHALNLLFIRWSQF